MKAIRFFYAGFLLLTFGCNNKVVKNDLTWAELYGKVKSVKTISYDAIDKFGEITKGNAPKGHFYFVVYNKRGDIIESCEFCNNGTLYTKSTYIHDNEGYVLKTINKQTKFKKKTLVLDNGQIDVSNAYRYIIDKNGNKKSVLDSIGTFETTSIIKYDDKRNVIECTNYTSTGKVKSKTTNKYDENNFISESCDYDSVGNLKFKSIYKNNSKGNVIELKGIKSDGTIVRAWTYIYDLNGNEIEKKCYISPGNFENGKRVSKYDKNGKVIKIQFLPSDGRNCGWNTYKYDSKGNDKEYIGYNSDGSIEATYSYEYIYDKNGNWIKKIEFKNRFPQVVTERQIEYYD